MLKETVIRATPQRAHSEETRRLILDRALALFRERGLEETTVRDVAKAAGLSVGAAYYYFDSKEAIVGEYYEQTQQTHLSRARELYAHGGDLRARLRGAIHAKIDILQNDRPLLRALFRYGGDPSHPLSWFGPGSRRQRESSILVFTEALAGERLPEDVREVAPVVLWALHMGILLFFLHDTSEGQQRTRRLIDASVDFTVDARRLITSPLLRPVRRRVLNILRDAGLIGAPEAA